MPAGNIEMIKDYHRISALVNRGADPSDEDLEFLTLCEQMFPAIADEGDCKQCTNNCFMCWQE